MVRAAVPAPSCPQIHRAWVPDPDSPDGMLAVAVKVSCPPGLPAPAASPAERSALPLSELPELAHRGCQRCCCLLGWVPSIPTCSIMRRVPCARTRAGAPPRRGECHCARLPHPQAHRRPGLQVRTSGSVSVMLAWTLFASSHRPTAGQDALCSARFPQLHTPAGRCPCAPMQGPHAQGPEPQGDHGAVQPHHDGAGRPARGGGAPRAGRAQLRQAQRHGACRPAALSHWLWLDQVVRKEVEARRSWLQPVCVDQAWRHEARRPTLLPTLPPARRCTSRAWCRGWWRPRCWWRRGSPAAA